MTDLVPRKHIERIVGITRHRTAHFGRAVSDEQVFYILHSQKCLDSQPDLRDCLYSRALDRGIDTWVWSYLQDRPALLNIMNGRLVPGTILRGEEEPFTSEEDKRAEDWSNE